MPAVPLPFLTFVILLMLLTKVCLQRGYGYRSTATFIAGCALLVLMSALRWQFDALYLRQIQSIVAIALPPLAWRCFARLTERSGRQKLAICLIPSAIALGLNLVAPATTDAVLMALYVGYGCTLIGTAYQGPDAFIFTRLNDAGPAARMAFLAGSFLCFSGLTDLAIAVDFSFYQGHQAPQLVALSQAILLPFICLAIIYNGKNVPPDEGIPATESQNNSEALALLCQRVEARLCEQSLYLSPDLTLNTLARRMGIPARQISQAVNQTQGCNVSQWINRFRIHHAQRQLLATDASVTEIMLEAGFATKSNFNREFTRISGMSPTEYRRSAEEALTPAVETRPSRQQGADGYRCG